MTQPKEKLAFSVEGVNEVPTSHRASKISEYDEIFTAILKEPKMKVKVNVPAKTAKQLYVPFTNRLNLHNSSPTRTVDLELAIRGNTYYILKKPLPRAKKE